MPNTQTYGSSTRKLSIVNLFVIAIYIANTLSCSQSSIRSKQKPLANNAAPKISAMHDIAYHKVIDPNVKPSTLGDGRFSPGEMVLIQGKQFINARVTVDGRPAKTISTDFNSLIFQIPNNIEMLSAHKLVVKNQFGTDKSTFNSTHYIVGTDTDGNKHHIMRTNPGIKGYIDEEIVEIEQTRPMFNAISDDGSILYTVGVQSKVHEPEDNPNNQYGLEINIFHLNAPQQPKRFKTANAHLYSAPIAFDTANNELAVILGKRDFALLDISNPTEPKQIVQYDLPLNADDTVYLDAIFLNHHQQLAVLETYENKVLLFDITNPSQPKLTDEIKLIPEIGTAYSVDLVRNEISPNQFWVLTGKNLRDLSARTQNMVKSIIKRSEKEEITQANATLIPIAVNNNKLQEKPAIQLPDRINPFFAVHDGKDHLYVSTIHSDFLKAFKEEENWIKKIQGLLFKSTRFGKIFKVNLETGHTEIEAEGFGIYFHLTYTQALGPVFTLSKLKGTLSSPYIKPAWGIGIKTRGTYALRAMGTRTIYPPYSLGHISVQK